MKKTITGLVSAFLIFCLYQTANAYTVTNTLEDIGASGTEITTINMDRVAVTISTSDSSPMKTHIYNESPWAFNGAEQFVNIPLRPNNVSGTHFIKASSREIGNAQPIIFEFSEGVMGFGLTTIDLLESNYASDFVMLEARNSDGIIVDTHTRNGDWGSSGLDLDWFVSSSTAEIVQVRLLSNIPVGSGRGGGYGLDDLILEITDSPPDDDMFGQTLKTSSSYEFSVEQFAQKSDSIQLFNSGDIPLSVTLEINSPNSDLLVSPASQDQVIIAPGESYDVSLLIDASDASVGIYDGILLKVSVDDGSTLYSNITVYVTKQGDANLPDLTVSGGDIRHVSTDSDGQVTYMATIHNRGGLSATDVTVQFNDFGTLLGETVIPVVSSKGNANTSITIPEYPSGDSLIVVIIDPFETIPELDETNNEASKIIRSQDTSGGTDGKILIIGGSSKVCPNAFFTVTGKAVYDITVDGVRPYVVKGGSVRITSDLSTHHGDIYTDVTGNFSRSLVAPESPGPDSITMTVTDNTFSGTGTFDFEVAGEDECSMGKSKPWCELIVCGICKKNPELCDGKVNPYELVDAILNLYEWACSNNNCPAVPEQDVFVYSKHILFKNDHPVPNEEVSIYAQIQYFATGTNLPSEEIQVNFHVISPGASMTKLPQKVIDSIPAGNYHGIFANWKPLADGIYIIEVEIDPSYEEQNIMNNAATRAIIVGQYASGQGAVSGQVNDSLGGVDGVLVRVISTNGIVGSTITDDTGFYLVQNVPVGDYQVQIEPSGYADAEIKVADVADQSVSIIDFTLTEQEDATPPIITPTLGGTLGNNGWYTSNVTVSWLVTDDESSVIDQVGCEAITVTNDTPETNFTCSATSSGGTASNSITIKRDITPPTIIGSFSPSSINANGWHNSMITVNFTCADITSGVATCTAAQILTEGSGQSVNGTATDNAGNEAGTQVLNINIDLTAPEVSVTGVTNGAIYTIGSVPAAGCATTDPLSGVQTSAMLNITGGNSNGVGTFTASCSEAMDLAENSGNNSVTYQVIYPFEGFFKPVDSPPMVNIIRAGSAVPVKFSLVGDRGLDILANSPSSEAMSCGGEGTVKDFEETMMAGNSSLNYDPLTDQYIYIWKTNKTLKGCRLFTITLNDGTVHKSYYQFR